LQLLHHIHCKFQNSWQLPISTLNVKAYYDTYVISIVNANSKWQKLATRGIVFWQDVHCYNVIPMEITERICESIVAGKRQESFYRILSVRKITWGRCYDHNFLRFFGNFRRKNWLFSQNPMLWSKYWII
jgi:hypothetical protein